jgi:hypothetical protein
MISSLSRFKNKFKTEVQQRLVPNSDASVIRDEDLTPLPEPVRNYLRYVGAVGKPKVHNFRVAGTGSMKRSFESNWIEISTRQYNFFDDLARIYYIKSSLFGIPFDGLHAYTGDSATMKINVAYFFQVVDAKGEKMNQSENVTLFNDMCLLAPATLINKKIQWESIDKLTAKARFTHNGITITALLSFNENGELVNFVSDDRFLSSDGKTYTNYPWSTPVKDYKDFNGRKVPIYGEAIWHMPGRDFTYAQFITEEIEYNCSGFRN